MTLKSKLISLALGVFVTLSPAAFSQSARTVMVQSNTGVLLYPSNFWNANASTARSGLGLGTLAQSNAISISNVTGLQGVLDAKLSTNPSLAISNVTGLQSALDSKLGTNTLLAVANGGTGATNAGGARTNLGLGVTNAVQFRSLSLAGGDLYFGDSGDIGWDGVARYEPETQTFYGDVYFDNGSLAIVGPDAGAKIAATRTNLGIPWTGLTNTSAGSFRAALLPSYSNNASRVLALNSTATDVEWVTVTAGGVATNISISNVTGLQTALDGKLATNPTLAISNVSGLQTALNGKLESTNTAANITANTYQFQVSTNTAPSIFQQLGFRSQAVTFGGFYTAYDGTFKLGFAHGSATNNLEDRVVFRPNSLELAVPFSFIGTNSATAVNSSRSALGLSSTNAVTFDRLITASTGSFTNYALQLGATNIGIHASTGPELLYFQNRGGTLILQSDGTVSAPTFSANTFNVNSGGSITFSLGANIAATRTNLGLGAAWLTNTGAASFRNDVGLPLAALTNTNATGLRDALGIGTTNVVTFGSIVVQGGVSFGTNNTTGAATTRTNLGLGWPALTNTNSATSLLGVSTNGQVVTSTNVTFTNAMRALSSIVVGTNGNLQVNSGGMSGFDSVISLEEGFLVLHDGASSWDLSGSGFVDVGTIAFVDTNAATSTRNNLQLGWSGLTNTNATTFQGALFAATNAAPINTNNVAAWINLQVGTNTYKLPLYQ